MLAPKDIEELQGKSSRYAVVVGVAKRARQITEEAEENKEILVDKTVSLAIKDFKEGNCSLFVDTNED
ncbi:MAG: DNA-directed RNA polymerase subunit omega [Ruminococcaceae bacterium]|nr:DNA-directed RNA polymerase subunit omega [Oscillospiraceae bacterium]